MLQRRTKMMETLAYKFAMQNNTKKNILLDRIVIDDCSDFDSDYNIDEDDEPEQ